MMKNEKLKFLKDRSKEAQYLKELGIEVPKDFFDYEKAQAKPQLPTKTDIIAIAKKNLKTS